MFPTNVLKDVDMINPVVRSIMNLKEASTSRLEYADGAHLEAGCRFLDPAHRMHQCRGPKCKHISSCMRLSSCPNNLPAEELPACQVGQFCGKSIKNGIENIDSKLMPEVSGTNDHLGQQRAAPSLGGPFLPCSILTAPTSPSFLFHTLTLSLSTCLIFHYSADLASLTVGTYMRRTLDISNPILPDGQPQRFPGYYCF